MTSEEEINGPICIDFLINYVWNEDLRYSEQQRPPTGVVIHKCSVSDKSFHFAWSTKRNDIVQCIALDRRAHHSGKFGDNWIGICLPFENILYEKIVFRGLMRDLISALPMLQYWTRYNDINRYARDPGDIFDASWINGIQLEYATPIGK